MSKIFAEVRQLVRQGDVRISDHGYDELAADSLFAREVLNSIDAAIVIEDYPDYMKGPCVLVLQKDRNGDSIHVVWGIPKDTLSPAVLITAYRPDPERWEEDFMRRKR